MLKNKKTKEKDIRKSLKELETQYEENKTVELQFRGGNFKLRYDSVYIREALDIGTKLLAEVPEIKKGDKVLEIFSGSGIAGIVAAGLANEEGEVYLADSDIAAIKYANENLKLNQVRNTKIIRLEELTSLEDGSFDVVLMNILLQSQKEVIMEMLEKGATVLKPGGKFYLAGGKKKGILSFSRRLKEIFGNAKTVSYKKGYRVVVATRSESLTVAKKKEKVEKRIKLRDRQYRIVLEPGVFAMGDLDEGTKMLIESMEIGKDNLVLDLGCGSGLIGMVAANLAPEGKVYLVDSNLLAINLARKNLELNGIKNAIVLESDFLIAVCDIKFDVIVTNPPFHLGREKTTAITERFVEEAFRGLKKKGKFYLVANKFLPYEKRIKECFGNVKVVAQDNKYKVLLARR